MKTHFRFAAATLVLAACMGTAGGQTLILRESAETEVYVREPIELSPVQRRIIYRGIIREPSPAPVVRERLVPVEEYRVGVRVPSSVEVYDMPDRVAVQVPTIRRYRYTVVDDRVLIVDPVTNTVVGEIYD